MAWCFGVLDLPATIPAVARQLSIDEKHGIGLFDLAKAAIRDDVRVDLYAWDAAHFPGRWFRKPSNGVLRDLERSRPQFGSWKAALVDDLTRGTLFHAEPISTRDIESRLAAGQCALLYINSAVLYGKRDGVRGHYIVLLKLAKDTVTIMDPHWKHGGIKRYPRDLFLFAFWSVGGYCLFLSRPRSGRRRSTRLRGS